MVSNELVHSTGPERTLEQRDLEVMRRAKQNAPRPRKPTVLREVTSGIKCFCGERFGEHQALEFMLHLRAEVGETLDWAAGYKARRRAHLRTRYKNDEQYRVSEQARTRESHKRKYAEDLEWKAKVIARNRARRAWRMEHEPGYRERELAKGRERAARARARAKDA